MNISKNLNKSELVAAGLLLALGISIVVQAWNWTYLTKDGPGPGFFPLWTGIGITLLSAGVAVLHVYAVIRQRPVERTIWDGSVRVLAGWAGLALSIALLKPAGFFVSFLLLVLFLVTVIFNRGFVAALAVGLGASAGFWLLFSKLLKVQLPTGPWGF